MVCVVSERKADPSESVIECPSQPITGTKVVSGSGIIASSRLTVESQPLDFTNKSEYVPALE